MASQRTALAVILILLMLTFYGFLSSQLFALNILGTMFLYLALAQSWNLLGGYGGYPSFGHVVFFGIGVYTSAILWQELRISPFVTAPLAGLVAAVAGLLVGLPTLRLRGSYFALVTLILAFAAQILAFNLSITQGALGIFLPALLLPPVESERLFYLIFLCLAASVTALVYAFEHSTFGWALIAIRDDEDAAEVSGVHTVRVKTWTNAIACFIAGVSGALYAQRISYVEPTTVFSLDISLNIVLIAIVGGAGSWLGPIIGAPLVLLTSDLLRINFPTEVNRALFGTTMMIFALLIPRGIIGAFSRSRSH